MIQEIKQLVPKVYEEFKFTEIVVYKYTKSLIYWTLVFRISGIIKLHIHCTYNLQWLCDIVNLYQLMYVNIKYNKKTHYEFFYVYWYKSFWYSSRVW